MSPELEERIKREETKKRIEEAADPIYSFFKFDNGGVSGTLTSLTLSTGRLRIVSSMMTIDAISLLNQQNFNAVVLLSKEQEKTLCMPAPISQIKIVDVDHLLGTCRVIVDIRTC